MRPRHGNPCEPLAAGLGAGAAGGQPGVGPGARQLPYSGPRRHAGRATVGAGGENHLCTARRCAVYENGFAGVEPPLPAAFPDRGSCRWRRLPSRSPAVATAAPGRWRSSMTVFAPRRTVRRPKMVIVRCCGWRSKPAVGSRRAMPICFHRRRCRSITGWSLSSLPPAPPRRSAWGNICRRWVFSTREATAPDR